jgi:Xaa-Pro dipeptidase
MIGLDEFRERCLRAKKIMDEKGIDAICLFPSADMYYLTGFWTAPLERLLLCIISQKDNPLLIVPKLYAGQVKAESWISSVRIWTEKIKLAKQLKKIFREFQLLTGNIAVHDSLPLINFRLFQETAPKAKFTSTSVILSQMRMRKSENEIRLMEKAAKLSDIALEAAAPELRGGKREFELAARLEYEMRVRGSEGTAFETIVGSGPNGAFPHHTSSNRKISEGDFVVFDLGATYGRYCSDFTRTLVVKRLDSKMGRIYNVVRKAHEEATNAVRPGVTVGAIDHVARRVITKSGYGKYLVHRTGHGVGLEVHESPYIREGDKTRLEQGMTFSIEPGLYVPGKLGIRIEDVVVVTKNGCRPLTKYPTELTVV